MKIGDKVKVKNVLRCLSHSGAYTYLDKPIDIEGIVTQKFNHFSERVCIEFKADISPLKGTLWIDVADIPPQD